jgi:hypothetical protein
MLGTFLQDLVQLKNTVVIVDSSQCFRHLASWKMDFEPETITLYPIKPE